MSHILEISKKANRAGRVPIKIALLKIHDDAEETNLNGLHWDETYVTNAIESLKMMPICAEFCTEDKDVPVGHGLTGSETNEKGLDEPIFENSEAVGVIENGSIETVEINGEEIKALCGSGYLFNQRYPKFVKWVRANHALGNVDTSIEIVGLESNANKIVYLEDEPKEEFRTPCEFSFSGTAILSVTPSDSNAIVLEIAQKKEQEEEKIMFDEKVMRDVIVNAINETNSKNSEYEATITELNSTIAERDNTIVELNATVEQIKKALADLETERDSYWAEREALQKELGELKAKARLGELNSAIENFSDEEKAYAEVEINSFNEDPMAGDVDAIVNKIYAGIGAASKKAEADARVAEQNSAKDDADLDIFAEVNSAKNAEEDSDVNIF
jgi:uncharacterized coiled-coil protein SlyX